MSVSPVVRAGERRVLSEHVDDRRPVGGHRTLAAPPGNTGGRGGRPEKHRRRLVLDAIFYLLTGRIAWAALPHGSRPTRPSTACSPAEPRPEAGSRSTTRCATRSASTKAATPPRRRRSSTPSLYAAPTPSPPARAATTRASRKRHTSPPTPAGCCWRSWWLWPARKTAAPRTGRHHPARPILHCAPRLGRCRLRRRLVLWATVCWDRPCRSSNAPATSSGSMRCPGGGSSSGCSARSAGTAAVRGTTRPWPPTAITHRRRRGAKS